MVLKSCRAGRLEIQWVSFGKSIPERIREILIPGYETVRENTRLSEKKEGFNFRGWQLKPFLFTLNNMSSSGQHHGFGPPVRPASRESPDFCPEEEPPGVELPGEGAVPPLPEEEAPGPPLE